MLHTLSCLYYCNHRFLCCIFVIFVSKQLTHLFASCLSYPSLLLLCYIASSYSLSLFALIIIINLFGYSMKLISM